MVKKNLYCFLFAQC